MEVITCDTILNSPIPMVIKDILDWSQLEWTLEDWKINLHEPNKKYPFRKGVYKCSETPQWERTCQIVNLTIEEFFNIIADENHENPEHWYYFDYKHLEQWFNHNITLQGISWSCLGMDNVPSPTIWIGSKGAHTPCHYDTYGHNLVAQLYGKKMWILFPPNMTDSLKPCRVPYEESSVYSKINFFCGCADTSGIESAYYVVLEPGDILYVPKNWWHYVENVTDAISINTWLPKLCDNISRLEESLAKSLITSFLQEMSQSDRDHILNPNEDDLPSSYNLDELSYCLRHSKNDTDLINPGKSILKPINGACLSNLSHLTNNQLKQILDNKCLNPKPKQQETKIERTLQLDDIINSFCHPEVLSLARKKLQQMIHLS